ncbi:MAG: hypothetical protein HY855_20035 [Burkholderiales bacterium]|nr:hypothetical protein [Burkholderiales bacterium]
MAQLNIRGQVLHAPGPWGRARPAAGVALAIVDEDVGNTSDTIWTGHTNAQGQYAGTTRDWRDTRSVTVATPSGPRTTQVADATDVMLLKATASQRIGTRAYSTTVPYVPAPAGLPQPPIVLGWGPLGLARVMVDGVAASTLSHLAQLIQGAFGVGYGVASLAVRHEIVVYGEQVDLLRDTLADLDAELRGIEALIRPQVQRDLARLRTQTGPMQTNMQANGARAVAAGVAVGRAVNPGPPPGPDPWAPIRQRLSALPQLLAQRLQQRAQWRDQQVGTCLVMVCAAVLRILVELVVSSVRLALTGALLWPAVVAAVVGCVVTVVQNLPALVAMIAAATNSSALADASVALGEFIDSGWLSSALTLIVVLCAVVMLLAAAPIDGWTWFVEQVTGENGLPGLRVVFTR